MDLTKYEAEILETALLGFDTPAACAEYLFRVSTLKPDVAEDVVASLARLMATVDFNRTYQRMKEDVVGTILESFKRTAMENARQMKELAKDCTDDRVKFSANKDILDRIGLQPTGKSVVFTPADWARELEGLRKKAVDSEVKDKSNAEVQRVQGGEAN